VAKKGNRINIQLQCTEAKEAGVPPSRYATSKNRKNSPNRLEMMKYNPFLRRHTLHREVK
jgi:large subunit ribosomal protein L33